jgi:hypothetical protein
MYVHLLQGSNVSSLSANSQASQLVQSRSNISRLSAKAFRSSSTGFSNVSFIARGCLRLTSLPTFTSIKRKKFNPK